MRNINILHVDSERTWRGGQQQAMYLFSGMLERGFRTAMVTRTGSEMAKLCREKEFPVYELPMRGEIDIWSAWKIAKICKDNNFRILHLHSAHAVAIGALAKYFFSALKLIGVRRVDFPVKNNFFSRQKYLRMDTIVCISENIRRVMLQCGFKPEQLTTIHSGIDTRKFADVVPDSEFRIKEKIPANHLIIGTTAALVGHKDYPTLLKAAKLVLDVRSDITFMAAGEGYKRESLEQLHRELKLSNNFRFLGFRKDVGNLLKQMDLFVLSSHLEGLGTSILDAMALGLSVVGTEAGGIPEMVSNNFNGLLVPRKNPERLASALLKLCENSGLREKLGENALQTADKFKVSKMVEKNIGLYGMMR
ncbi:MAG: glycosyltransferase [Candidatus Cloacimonetes bacterium]|nr:glycosyltransferase [Candidatus Cloacimonadota bacterium]